MNTFIRSRLSDLLASREALNLKHVEDLLNTIRNYHPPTDDGKVTSLYSDSSMNGDSGKYAWASVTNNLGRCVITQLGADAVKDMEIKEVKVGSELRKVALVKFGESKQQNNGGEMVAFLIALRIAATNPAINNIFLDSSLIFNYWSKGHVKKATKDAMDKQKLAYLEECVKLRKAFEDRGGKVALISGDTNPSDLGYH